MVKWCNCWGNVSIEQKNWWGKKNNQKGYIVICSSIGDAKWHLYTDIQFVVYVCCPLRMSKRDHVINTEWNEWPNDYRCCKSIETARVRMYARKREREKNRGRERERERKRCSECQVTSHTRQKVNNLHSIYYIISAEMNNNKHD